MLINEDEELLEMYHEALVSSLTPKKMVQMYQDMFGHEKWMGMKRMLESGVSCYIFLFLTSLYQKDKQKFLIDGSFFHWYAIRGQNIIVRSNWNWILKI